jgi:O-antigen/teichoic acid export membrane protein
MSLTNKTLHGFLWAFLERFGTQAIQLVIFIVLARMLAPKVFGLIGMLAVFIAVSQSLIDSGFGQALIQKKDTDEVDYSSVFYINLVVSVCLYGILYLAAPYISGFYGEPHLTALIRVLGVKFIIAAFSLVQIAKLTKEVNFKSLMIARLPSTLIGGVSGIGAAYMGFGVWSLIIQQLTNSTAYSLQIWIQSGWWPSLVFDWERVKSLFDFGSKMMIEGVMNTVYKNFYKIIIGRYFSAAQVGFYSMADRIKHLPVQNLSNSLSRVSFPVLADIQDDDVRLKRAYKKILRQVFLVISPLMIGGVVLAHPLFEVVLTDKWMPAVPYFQWLCVSGLFYPANSYNLNILKVKGRSDLFLKLGLIKKGLAVIGILIIVQYSVLALVIFKAFFSIFAYFVNSYYSGQFIDYGVGEQFADIWKFLAASLIMGWGIWVMMLYLPVANWALLISGVAAGAAIYLAIIYITEYDILQYSVTTFKGLVAK